MAPQNRMQVQIMGACEVCGPDGQAVTMPTRKCRGLLAYLCQAQGRDVPREELAALLWPRRSETQARASLRQELAVLRKVLAGAGIVGVTTGKDRVRFVPQTGVIDTVEMERLLDRPTDREAWRRAAQLYRGAFLGDLNLRAGPFEDWLWLERQRLKNRMLEALQRLLDHDLSGDDAERAIATTDMLLTIDPTHEQAYRAKMRLLRRSGRRAEALQLYRHCVDILRRELDADPSLETTMLADRIRTASDTPANHPGHTARRLHLTVVCVAITGPEEMAVAHDPEALARSLGRFQQRAERVVAACGGQIVSGFVDKVVAVFGHPAADPADCETAVQAALSLVAEPVSLSDQRVLWPRAGVAAGEMLIALPTGQAGAVLVGDALLRAGGLLHLARAGQVIVGPHLPAHLTGHYATEPVGAPPARLQRPGLVLRRARPRDRDQPA